MAKEKKPEIGACPFCGGKMTVSAGISEWHFWCENDKCQSHICFPIGHGINVFEDEAIKKFNTRTSTDMIHCKDCKYFGDTKCVMFNDTQEVFDRPNETDFCSFAVKKRGKRKV